jgi:hypothetical protein
MNKKFEYQVGNNKKVILWCTANQISHLIINLAIPPFPLTRRHRPTFVYPILAFTFNKDQYNWFCVINYLKASPCDCMCNQLLVKNHRQNTVYLLCKYKLHTHISVLTNHHQATHVFKFKTVFILAVSVFSLIYQPLEIIIWVKSFLMTVAHCTEIMKNRLQQLKNKKQ